MTSPSPKTPRRPLRGEEREEALARAVKAYSAPGASVRVVALELGFSYGRTHALLTDAGVLRARNGQPRQTGEA